MHTPHPRALALTPVVAIADHAVGSCHHCLDTSWQPPGTGLACWTEQCGWSPPSLRQRPQQGTGRTSFDPKQNLQRIRTSRVRWRRPHIRPVFFMLCTSRNNASGAVGQLTDCAAHRRRTVTPVDWRRPAGPSTPGPPITSVRLKHIQHDALAPPCCARMTNAVLSQSQCSRSRQSAPLISFPSGRHTQQQQYAATTRRRTPVGADSSRRRKLRLRRRCGVRRWAGHRHAAAVPRALRRVLADGPEARDG